MGGARDGTGRGRGLLLALAAIAFVLCLAEVALRLLAPVPDPFEGTKSRQYVNQYIRSAFKPHMRLETRAEDGLPGITGPHAFTTNNVGLRGDSLAMPRPADELRVFVIGGSAVEGLYLDDSESVTAVLQRAMPRRDGRVPKVYNAGKSGDKSDDHISMLAHRLVHLQPDLVVVMAGFNDLRASAAGFDYLHLDPRPAFSAAALPPLRLRQLIGLAATEFQLPRYAYYALKRMRPRSARETQETIALTSSVGAAAAALRRLPQASHPPVVDSAAFRRNLETLVGIARGHGIELVLVTHPATWRSTDSAMTRWHWMRAVGDTAYSAADMAATLDHLNDVTRSVAAARGVPLYDLARALAPTTAHFYDDTHFNVAGARAAGEGLAAFLAAAPRAQRTLRGSAR